MEETRSAGDAGVRIATDRLAVAKGAVALAIGVGLLVMALSGGRGLGVLPPAAIALVGVALALFGVLTVLVAVWTRASLRLSRKEWALWGPVLEPRTDEVLDRLAGGERPGAVADDLLDGAGVPRDVTLRWIIHVGSRPRS